MVQRHLEFRGAGGSLEITGQNVMTGYVLAVKFMIGFGVRPKRGALERNTREKTTRPRVSKHLGVHFRIRLGRGSAAQRTSCYRRVTTEGKLVGHQMTHAAIVHDEQYNVGLGAPDLE